MSDRSSSFDDLTDLESVKSGTTSTFEVVGVAEGEDLKAMEVAELQATIRRLNEELEKMKMKAKSSTEQETILSAINGIWQTVSLIEFEEYLQLWKPSAVENAFFQVGLNHFQYDEATNTLTSFVTVGTQKRDGLECKLGEKSTCDGKTFVSFVKDNVLITAGLGDDGEEYMRVERFVKNGQLHLVTKRFGMNCTRVCEKIGTSARYSGAAESGRIKELEEELARRAEEIRIIKEQTNKAIGEPEKMEDQKELNDKMRKDMKKEIIELSSSRNELKKQLLAKKMEANVLALRIRSLKDNENIAAAINTRSLENRILGSWYLQFPFGVYSLVPRRIIFKLCSNVLTIEIWEDKQAGIVRKSVKCEKEAWYSSVGDYRTRAYFEENKIWMESFNDGADLIEACKMWMEGDILKATFFWTNCRQEVSYRQIISLIPY